MESAETVCGDSVGAGADVSGSGSPGAARREAVRLLAAHGADPSSASATGAAAERIFSGLRVRFGPLVGEKGYRGILVQAHARTVKTCTILEELPVKFEGNPYFGGLGGRLGRQDPAEVWNAVTSLLEEFIHLSGGLGRLEELAGSPPGGWTEEQRLWKGGSGTEAAPAPESMKGGGDGGGVGGERRGRKHEPFRVLIMDRDLSTCQAIARALSAAGDFQVVANATRAEEAEQMVSAADVDFVVATSHLPSEEVLGVCRWIRKHHSQGAPYVVVTGLPPDEAIILRFLEAGATGFTLEDFSVEGLRLTLRLIARGEAVFPLRLQHLMAIRVSELAELIRDRGLDPDLLASLTKREREVLDLLEKGLTNRETAKRLYVSEGTVKSHVHQILKKLRVSDRREAVRLLRLQRAAPSRLELGRETVSD